MLSAATGVTGRLYCGAESGRGKSGDISSHTSGDVQARRLSWKEQVGDAEEDAVVGQYSVSRL